MKILLDLQACQSPGSKNRGIGRYSLALARAIARNRKSHEISLLLSNVFPDEVDLIRQEFRDLLDVNNIYVFHMPWPTKEIYVENTWRARVAELVREYAVALIEPDVVHISSLFEGYCDNVVSSAGRLFPEIRTVITLYDLIPYLDQDRYLPGGVERKWYMRKIEDLKQAHGLLAISNSSMVDAAEHLSIEAEKIVNISSAVDSVFSARDISSEEMENVLNKYGIQGSFIMSAGVVEPRKNLEGLIRAYSLLPAKERKLYKLVLVGSVSFEHRLYLESLTKKNGIPLSDVVFPGFVSDEHLIALYNHCHLFVFPSLQEGFGLPALEAMACGCAVIGSNSSSIPEVIGRDDALFDPRSPDDMAKLIEKAILDTEFHTSLRKHAVQQARKFSWDESARKAIIAFEKFSSEYDSSIDTKASVPDHNEKYQKLIAAIDGISEERTVQDLLLTAVSIAENESVAAGDSIKVSANV